MARHISSRSRSWATGLFLGSIVLLLSFFAFQTGTGGAAPRTGAIPLSVSATPTVCVGYNGGPWAEMAPFPYAAFNAASVSDGTYYYLFDNFAPNGTSYRYDPVAQSWTRLADMPVPGDAFIALYHDGRIYVFGGSNGIELATTRVYEIATNTWSQRAPMPEPRTSLHGGLYNGRIYLAGGYYINDAQSQTWEYDIAADTWATKANMPLALYQGAFATIGQHLYVFGGGRGGGTLASDRAFRYDAAADTWSELATLPYGVEGARSSLVGDTVWVYGGYRSLPTPGYISSTVTYDPAANSYLQGPNLNRARAYHAGGNIGPRSIAIGANDPPNYWQSVEISEITYGPCFTSTPVPPTFTPTFTRTPTRTNTPTVTSTPTPGCDNRWGEYPIGAIGQDLSRAAVGVVAPNDVWVVSGHDNPITGGESWTMHWDGEGWTRVPSPNRSGVYRNDLQAISILSANDIWAAGYAPPHTVGAPSTLTMHWDGIRWNMVPSPGAAAVMGIAAIAPNDVWAVGYSPMGYSSTTFTMHWNGTQWSVVPSPNPNGTSGSSVNRLNAVVAVSPTEVYAVGGGWAVDGQRAFALRWDGNQWNPITVPHSGDTGELYDVQVASNGDIWAVGIHEEWPSTALIVRNWLRVTQHPTTPGSVSLRALAVLSPTDVMVVGDYSNSGYNIGLSWRWDGSQWRSLPVPEYQITYLWDVAAAGPNSLWAAGRKAIPTRLMVLGFPDPTCFNPTPTATPVACNIQFQDALPGSTFYPYIHCLACQQIVSGYNCGNPEPCVPPNNYPYYRPGNSVTRGQLSKLVTISAGFNEPVTGQMFEDVPPGSAFYEYVERLASRGFISGYPCGSPGEPCEPGNRPYFRPGNDVTRGQAAKIVSNAAGYYDPYYLQVYEDVPPDHPFHVYIVRLTIHEVLGGYPCGNPEPCVPPNNRPYFRPGNSVTRGQAAKIVSNAFFPGCNPPPP